MVLRDQGLFTADFVQALHHHGAVPSLAVHPLPRRDDQFGQLTTPHPRPLAIRWLVRRGRRDGKPRPTAAPSTGLSAAAPDSRDQVVTACRAALAAAREVYVIANHKAEGASPPSLATLARELVAAQTQSG